MIYSILLLVFGVLMTLYTFWVAITYAIGNRQQDRKGIINQDFVKPNRQIFGISDKETPEIEDVHIVEHGDLGINE